MEFIFENDINKVKQRLVRPEISSTDDIKIKVSEIIDNVKRYGDSAIRDYTKLFDKAELNTFETTQAKIKLASNIPNQTQKKSIAEAIQRIKDYHKKQYPSSITYDDAQGIQIKRIAKPIERVGLYVPGGSAPLISTVMMLAIPAMIAGCPVRYICTPCDNEGNINPYLLYTAKSCGIETIYKLGGAQAIAAMAFGTESIPKVDKIYGPGNAYVTEAKMQCSQEIAGAAIDMPAGPSEVLVIADESANPKFIAADLLSQAEHGTTSQSIIITNSLGLAKQVEAEIVKQTKLLERKMIIEKSLQHAKIIITNSIQEAIVLSNYYAPEHLILQIHNAENYMDDISAAGSVFIGEYACETFGDYITGSNHVLPTYGYAKNYSGLCVSDFMKFISYQTINRQGFENLKESAKVLAEIEGLTAHKQAIQVRELS